MRRFLLLALLFFLANNTIYGQNSNDEKRDRFVIVPSDQGLVLIVPQAGCQLRFEDSKLLAKADGPWIPSFSLRNGGPKPIRAFIVAAAGNGEWGWQASDPARYLMPGEIAPLGEDVKNTIVPLTESLRDQLKLRGPMKAILALLVVHVEYADGSSFDEAGYSSLKEYFEKLYLQQKAEIRVK